MATKSQKTANKVIAAAAIGLGAYALYKSMGGGSASEQAGEGALGGSEDMFGEEGLFDDKQGFSMLGNDPNTIPEQPETIYPTQPDPNVDPISPTIQDISQSINPSYTPYTPIPTSPSVDTNTGLFGTGISAGEAALGVTGLLPSAATTFGQRLVKQSDDAASSIFKRIIPEAVEETPFVGKKLADFAFKQTDEVAFTTSESLLKATGDQAIKNIGSEAAEAGAKGTFKFLGKKAGKAAVGSIPLVGVAAGAEFDVLVDNRPRWIAYPANILGDVVGGALGIVTAPAAVTGVGAAVPVAATVAGQIATESAVYGIYDTLTGNNKLTPEQQKETFVQTQQMMNQGTIVPDSYFEAQFDTMQQPTIKLADSFALGGSSKNKATLSDDDDIDLSRFKPDGTGGFLDTVSMQSVSPQVASQRSSGGSSRNRSSSSSSNYSSLFTPTAVVMSSVVNQSTPKTNVSSSGGSSGGSSSSSKSSAVKIVSGGGSSSSRSTSSSAKIDSSRFVAQSGGGYSDTKAMQSVSASEAAKRSSNPFSSSINYSPAPKSSSSSNKTSSSSAKNYTPAPAPKATPKPAPKQSVVSKVKSRVSSWFKR